MSLNLHACDKICVNCIRKYKQKHSLIAGQPFEIKCNGIPRNNPSLFKHLDEDDSKTALTVLDPVTWASETLDWHCQDPDGSIWQRKNPDEYNEWIKNNPDKPILGHSRYHRDYQLSMLKCSARRKVFRLGRQCLAEDTLVNMQDGSLQKIKDLQVNNEVVTINTETGLSYVQHVVNKIHNGKQDVYRITTKFGHIIECTKDHEFFINSTNRDLHNGITGIPEWKSIETGIKIGNKIATLLTNDRFKNISCGNWAAILGYFIADGSCSWKQSAKFTNINPLYLSEFDSLCRLEGMSPKWYPKGKGFDLLLTTPHGTANLFRELLAECKLINITGPQKTIPSIILNATKNEIALFLNRFWAADGYVSTFIRTGRSTLRTEIGTLQENKYLLEQLQQILYKFGVHGYIKAEGKNWRYVISNKTSIVNFLKNIGPIFGKEEACVRALANISKIGNKFVGTEQDILWDYVSSIKYIGKKEVYDIEVSLDHNFIGNGILVKNCGKTESLVISILYNMFTKPNLPANEGFRVIVIAPFQAQIDLIFKRIEELLHSNPSTMNAIHRNVKAPNYTIALHNGSEVKGFSAGTKSGGNADTVRGQHAHMLCLDEADMLSSGDIDSSLAIIVNHPDALLWMSSTPTGKRERFYNTCFSKQFREFHYPSHANPVFNESVDKLFKEQYTESGYKHEILAIFGEQEEGVFQNAYVQAAKMDYLYKDMTREKDWIYMIGVDWNDVKNGTTIAVVGFDPIKKLFIVVDRKIVSKEGWTQLSACNKIAEMNRVWRPLAIYVDSGFGVTQIEVLRKYGYDSSIDPAKGPLHADSKLKEIVKAYEFGSKIEVRDPWTHAPINKPAKPFLVESAVRRFESQDIKFSKHDELLERQLNSYCITRLSSSGHPVYKANEDSVGDHMLDAFMLAIVGFVLEISPFGKVTHSSDILFTGRIGERIDPPIFTGDTVIKVDRKVNEDINKTSRPDMNRANSVEKKSLLSPNAGLPASNMSGGQIALWDWPGFLKDSPKPASRSDGNQSQRTGFGHRLSSKPRRKNI